MCTKIIRSLVGSAIKPMVLLLPDANNVWILLDLICNLNLFGYSPALNRAQLTRPVGSAALPAIRFFFSFLGSHTGCD